MLTATARHIPGGKITDPFTLAAVELGLDPGVITSLALHAWLWLPDEDE